jgi:hypothetical protein
MFEKTGAIKCFAMALLAAGVAFAQASSTLDIYTIDVEGGNATLFVAPSGESLLIDTGNAGNQASRDAARILEATQAAGLKQIDHLIVTHWHGDHFGGLPELAPKIPIKEFIDHGPNVQPGELADTFLAKSYPQIVGNAKHTVTKAGDKIAMAGLDIRVGASAGNHQKPMPGAGKPNHTPNYKPGDNNAEDPFRSPFSSPMGSSAPLTWATSPKNKEYNWCTPTPGWEPLTFCSACIMALPLRTPK